VRAREKKGDFWSGGLSFHVKPQRKEEKKTRGREVRGERRGGAGNYPRKGEPEGRQKQQTKRSPQAIKKKKKEGGEKK